MKAHNSIRRCFERGSLEYDTHTPVQSKIAELLAEKISVVERKTNDPLRVLEVGCGTGSLTQILHEQFPSASMYALDISARMLAQARKRFSGDVAIQWICEDMSTFCDDEGFDYVVSSSSIHWASDQEEMFTQLRRLLKRDGTLVFSTMSAGTFAELHEARRTALPHKLPSRSLAPHGAVLRQLQEAGFRITSESEESFQQMYPGVVAFLKSMRAAGLTGGDLSHGDRLLTRGELARLVQAYEELYADRQGAVPASYRVSFISATPVEHAR